MTNEFAVDLFKVVSKLSGNIVVSPIGLQILLAMSQQGAKGVTAVEIGNVLYLPEDNIKVLADHKALIAGLDDPLLKLKTEIFFEKTYQLSPNFHNVVRKYFISGVHGVYFTKTTTVSREKISNCIGNTTKQEINNLLFIDSEAVLDKLILTNTVNLKAKWKHKFRRSETSDMPFFIKPDLVVNTKMMFLKEKHFCIMDSKNLDAKILEMPFVRNKFRMLIILPKKLDGLRDVESKLASLDLSEELLELWVSKVDLYLPRLKLELTINLKDILSQMGMPTAFTKEADFSGIFIDPFGISQVVQKTFIEIEEEEEEETTAFDGSDFLSYYNAPLKASAVVKCDHPFLFIILAQKEILFVGRLQNPLLQNGTQ